MVYILRVERFLGALDGEHLGGISGTGEGEVGGVAPALVSCSQCPLLPLPLPLLFVPSHTVRINAIGRARRANARSESAAAVVGGFGHLVQLQEDRISLLWCDLPGPALPFTGPSLASFF